MKKRFRRAAGLAVTVATGLSGCSSGMERLDRQTERLLAETSESLGPETATPTLAWTPGEETPRYKDPDYRTLRPETANPSSEELTFQAVSDTEDVQARLERYSEVPPDATELDLNGALAYASRWGREYRFAEELYILAVLDLIAERHLWGPRLFNDFSAEIVAAGDDGFYDTSLVLLNELGVTQRLPYGGEVGVF
jgi:hypothetical protein